MRPAIRDTFSALNALGQPTVWDAFGYLLTTLLFLTSIFLILLILVQRGKGGGLVGALGGMGGQSAFGAKAGGIFWATSIAAGFWILLCMASVMYNSAGNKVFAGASGANAADLEGAPNTIEGATEPGKAGETTTGAGTGAATTGTETTPATNADAGKEGEVSKDTDFAEEAAPAPADDKKE
jgi:preprotein translocase subunit SecG